GRATRPARTCRRAPSSLVFETTATVLLHCVLEGLVRGSSMDPPSVFPHERRLEIHGAQLEAIVADAHLDPRARAQPEPIPQWLGQDDATGGVDAQNCLHAIDVGKCHLKCQFVRWANGPHRPTVVS